MLNFPSALLLPRQQHLLAEVMTLAAMYTLHVSHGASQAADTGTCAVGAPTATTPLVLGCSLAHYPCALCIRASERFQLKISPIVVAECSLKHPFPEPPQHLKMYALCFHGNGEVSCTSAAPRQVMEGLQKAAQHLPGACYRSHLGLTGRAGAARPTGPLSGRGDLFKLRSEAQAVLPYCMLLSTLCHGHRVLCRG